MEMIYPGRCQCGFVRYNVSGEVEAFICHCDDCRSCSGAPCTAWGKIHNESFELLSGEFIEYHSSEAVTWSSCKTCGTGICYRNTESYPYIDFMLCTLDSPDDIPPSYHVQVQEKLVWLNINDGLPAYQVWRAEADGEGLEN